MMTKCSAMDGPVLDDVIQRLLEGRRGCRQVQLSESEIRQICLDAKNVLLAQPNLLDLHAPIKICGLCSHSFVANLSHVTLICVPVDSPLPL